MKALLCDGIFRDELFVADVEMLDSYMNVISCKIACSCVGGSILVSSSSVGLSSRAAQMISIALPV